VVYGNSIGTTVALHVAASRPVAGTVLQNPPPLRRMILERHGWWNLWLIALPVALSVPGDLDSVASAESVRAPGVFVTSQDDDTIPPSYQDHVFEAYAGPKQRLFTAGGHNAAMSRETVEAIRAAVTEFLR
jgi:pimeloyl-ACP methyl ester carboxylesterase